ncbi:MAG: DUF3618 domain-containing protein [Allosphingosinicella sp.]|uniref:DUF3618 domain-containing protein n=1 Tax=Allosphingosinicella sp. TaxID=2823234 RepID=UPI003920B607
MTTPKDLENAKRHAEWARSQLETTLGALQQRLHPKTLATEAWEGVRDKGNDIADDALAVVKDRPAAVSAAIGVFTLFLARKPLKRAVSRLWNGPEDDGRVTTHIDNQDINYEVAAPFVDPAIAKEGAIT